jgi:hypothetical protein
MEKTSKTIEILNYIWNVEDLEKIATEKHMVKLINEYKQDPNCYPAIWISGESLFQIEKASFIYAVKNFSY